MSSSPLFLSSRHSCRGTNLSCTETSKPLSLFLFKKGSLDGLVAGLWEDSSWNCCESESESGDTRKFDKPGMCNPWRMSQGVRKTRSREKRWGLQSGSARGVGSPSPLQFTAHYGLSWVLDMELQYFMFDFLGFRLNVGSTGFYPSIFPFWNVNTFPVPLCVSSV